ncbi:hypothetical protein MXD61_01980 [Frankia sp. AgPm24]|uniref:hypothetical protein n=1 Tax=Frankia sp. AgPm24 TaxID=631128 RepID=UPI00200C0B10|nr:hypothetical protein [Frankia sp. AgPm24]MCK9920688.1 hypothetical protein [Frankia sp. AgPm24]
MTACSPALDSPRSLTPRRNQDAQAFPNFCLTTAPDGRGMVLHRFPDASSGCIRAPAHILIGDHVLAGMALGLAFERPSWWCDRIPPDLRPPTANIYLTRRTHCYTGDTSRPALTGSRRSSPA